jgi:MFS family permease
MPLWPPRRARRLPRSFHRLLAAFAAANVADGIRAVAMPLLAVERTQDPVLVASLGVAQSLPYLLAGLPAGVVADRVDRRMLLAITNTVEAVLFVLVLVGVLLDSLPLLLLYLAALSLGTNETLRDTAASTALPALVPPTQLEDGNGRLVTVEFIANQLAGPALGAALFAAAAALPFALSGGLAAVAAVLVLRLPTLNRTAAPGPRAQAATGHRRRVTEALATQLARLRNDVTEGIGYLAQHRVLRTVAILAVVLTLTDAAWFAVLVLLVTEELGLQSSAYGIILAVAAVGGAAGGLAASWLIDRFGSAAALRGGLLVIGAVQIVLGVSHSAVLVTAALALGNVAFAIWLTAAASLRQALTPYHLLGRVTGAWRTAAVGAIPVGSLLGGLIAGGWGIRAPFLAGAPLVLTAALFARSLTSAAIQSARAGAPAEG